MKTLIGLGFEPVEVHYATDDGMVYTLSVWFNGVDVTGLLSQQQFDDIEMECYANEREIEINRGAP